MNRENKRKQYEKGYYKTHACEESFTCKNCGRLVVPAGAGSDHRNHCPNCLHSLHVDIEPGDRESDCGSLMEPIAVWVRNKGEWAIIHRCRRCGEISSNRVLADDNPMKLMSIAMKPLANPPFPLERRIGQGLHSNGHKLHGIVHCYEAPGQSSAPEGKEMTAMMGGEGELPEAYRKKSEE